MSSSSPQSEPANTVKKGGDSMANQDPALDQALRPQSWKHYIGQENIKQNLDVLLKAARERNHTPEHLLFHGPPGLGKTTLAHIIAKEAGCQLRHTSGPAIEKVGDLASILTNLSAGDMLFIDEIHRLNKQIEEILYPAMENSHLDIIVGKGPSARTIQLELPPFTLVAATTRMSLLSSPLRSRFSGGTFRLEFYTEDEIKKIILQSADVLGISIDESAAGEIARRSRRTPRVANYLLKRCRDYAQIEKGAITKESVLKALDLLHIDVKGLNNTDRAILETLIAKFAGGPVGIKTIAAALAEEESTIEEVHEPYLIQLGFIDRTPRGRIATSRAYQHLGYAVPEGRQEKLM